MIRRQRIWKDSDTAQEKVESYLNKILEENSENCRTDQT